MEIKYFTHLTHYSHEIVSELSEAKHVSLDVCFNVTRFMSINLILHYMKNCMKNIEDDILTSCGRHHYELFTKKRNNNFKYKDCIQRAQKAMELSFQKIIKYLELTSDSAEVKKSANVQKCKIMIEQSKELIGFLVALNLDIK